MVTPGRGGAAQRQKPTLALPGLASVERLLRILGGFRVSASLRRGFRMKPVSPAPAPARTTLLEKLIPRLTARGLTVSVIKHTHHGFDIDRPGKDSYRHREAGASECCSPAACAGRSCGRCAMRRNPAWTTCSPAWPPATSCSSRASSRSRFPSRGLSPSQRQAAPLFPGRRDGGSGHRRRVATDLPRLPSTTPRR